MNKDNVPSLEMPKYKSHKIVRALKIMDIDENILWFYNRAYSPIKMTDIFMQKHMPGDTEQYINGYYVVYPDGYESWSPETAFEEGYSLV